MPNTAPRPHFATPCEHVSLDGRVCNAPSVYRVRIRGQWTYRCAQDGWAYRDRAQRIGRGALVDDPAPPPLPQPLTARRAAPEFGRRRLPALATRADVAHEIRWARRRMAVSTRHYIHALRRLGAELPRGEMYA